MRKPKSRLPQLLLWLLAAFNLSVSGYFAVLVVIDSTVWEPLWMRVSLTMLFGAVAVYTIAAARDRKRLR